MAARETPVGCDQDKAVYLNQRRPRPDEDALYDRNRKEKPNKLPEPVEKRFCVGAQQ